MADFKSNNPERPENKTRAGKRPSVAIKSSDFIPKVFRTPVNTKWLDSTLDRMISKGSLETIEGFVGGSTGKEMNSPTDIYINTGTDNNLEPAIFSKNSSGDIVDVISVDDIAKSIKFNFEDYSYNAAYSSQAYVFAPPINIDKFVNYGNYYWITELPIIHIIDNSDISALNLVSTYTNKISATIATDYGDIVLHNGMRIEFSGSRYHPDIKNKIYLVTGVGIGIQFKLISETITVNDVSETYDLPITVYTDVVKHKAKVSGEFKELEIKDYLVIEKSDPSATGWSRANHWIHKNTLVYINNIENDIVVDTTSFNIIELLSSDHQAKRPIIEFDPYMTKMNHSIIRDVAESGDAYTDYKGLVTYVLGNDQYPDAGSAEDGTLAYTNIIYDGLDPTHVEVNGHTIPVNSIVVFDLESYSGDFNIYLIKKSGKLKTLHTLSDSNSSFTAVNNYNDITYSQTDYYTSNGKLHHAQAKNNANTAPLFRLKTIDNVWLDDLPGSDFTGSKVFSYKIGSGINDIELGFPLSYKDYVIKTEYEFVNNLNTETYHYLLDSSNIETEVKGYYFFDKGRSSYTNYIPSAYPLGAKTKIQVIADKEDVVVPVGSSNWEVDREYIIFLLNGRVTASEILIEGTYNRSRIQCPEIILTFNKEYVFHDLTPDQELKFWCGETGEDIETVIGHPVTVVRDGPDIRVTVDAPRGYVFYYGTTDVNNRGLIAVVTSDDQFYHEIYVNGEYLDNSEYEITSNSILISADALPKDTGNVIDIEYYSNDTKTSSENIQIPEVHTHNSVNTPITTFTLSETLPHWKSIIESTPNFEGNSSGTSNYYLLPKIKSYGGEIFMHEDVSIMHDFSYSNDSMNISRAIYEQATEWDSFKNRIINETQRVFKSENFTSVDSLTIKVIEKIKNIYESIELHSDSNMLYAHPSHSKNYVFNEDFDHVYGFGDNVYFSTDTFKSDHVYVYLSHNRDLDNVAVEQPLFELTDYTIVGNGVKLHDHVNVNQFTNGKPVLVKVYHHGMDERSGVPASMAKLGLSYMHIPTVVQNKIICHDGSEFAISENTDLFKISSPNFNPVAAVIFNIEYMIYSGYKKQVERGYNSPLKYMPSQHRGTWYDRTTIDNYLKHYYRLWKDARTDKEYVRDVSNPYDWWYGHIELDLAGHLKTKLPGHWAGAYNTLFGTHRPDIYPWHMLGFSVMPEWWEEYYSWSDTVKRDALISALTYGIVSKPGDTVVQDLFYARYYWDWENNCPVDLDNTLVSPELVLGEPDENDKMHPYNFGDWGDDEYIWRTSTSGQAALLDAILKLNPTKAWTDFFHTNVFGRSEYSDQMLHYNSNELISPNAVIYHNEHSGLMIKKISIQRSDSGIPAGTTLKFIGSTSGIVATANLNIDETGTVVSVNLTNRGYGYFSTPLYVLEYPEGFDPDVYPSIDLKIDMAPDSFWVGGINQVQENYAKRHGYDIDIPTLYKNLETALYQPLGGFTSDHLISAETESGLSGKFTISQVDRKIILNKGAVEDLLVASEIYVTKKDSGYIVSGVSPLKQEFKYYKVDTAKDYNNITLVNDQTIKKFKFFTDEILTLTFGEEFARIQDVYNFILGYYQYLESVGYTFTVSKESKALDFANWAIIADIDAEYTVIIGTSIFFNPLNGVVLEYGSLPGCVNEILAYDENGNITAIDYSDLCITRTTTTVQIHPRQYPISAQEEGENIVTYSYQSSTSTQYQEYQEPGVVTTPVARNIVCVASAVILFDHGILFNNTTQFGDTIFDDVKNQKHRRLRITGERTRDWDGSKTVPGYLVNNNTIIQNYDTAITDVIDFYDLNVSKFNKDHTIAETLTVGNITRDWILKLGLPANVVSKFYQGVIRNKGTNSVIDRIGRSNLVNDGRSTVDVFEEWMFKYSYYGDTIREHATELEINSSMVKSDPSIVNLSDNSITYINKETDLQFQMLPMDQVKLELPVAGNLQEGDTRYTALTIDDIESVFDTNAQYANYQTWSSKRSFRIGDVVRHQGDLWRANTNISYLNSIIPLEFSSSEIVTDVLFKHRNEIDDPDTPSAEIDGVKVWFDKEAYSYPDIVVTGTADPVVLSPANLIVDDIEIPLVRLVEQTIIDPDATNDGNPYAITEAYPSSSDVTGKTLSFTTFISGVSNTSTVNLQTYGTATYLTSTENLAGTAAQQIYTISTSMSTHNITSITVDSVSYNTPADWTISGQDITFTNPTFTGGEVITVNFVSTVPTYTMDAAQLKFAINSNVAGVTAIDSGTRVHIVMNAETINDTLTVNAASGNIEFGINAGIYLPTTTIVLVDGEMDLDYILSQIELVNTTGYLFVKTSSNELEITEFAKTSWTTSESLNISGTARSQLGLPATTTVGTPGVVNVSCSADEAVDFINAAGIPGIIASIVSGKITINSSNTEIDLGDREFNEQATIPTGVYYADFGLTDNEFIHSEWDLINTEDDALFNIWLANDSGLTKSTTSSITSKYFGWNVLQTHSFRMWGEIDAGNDTDDGNDAKVSLKSWTGDSRSYPMAAGDYVLILNSTTQPNIDGIHRVTRVEPTDPSSFYIDRFIEKSGKCESVMVLRSSRFNTYDNLISSCFATSYYDWKPGTYAWVTKDEHGVSCNLVWKNTGSAAFELVYSNFDRIKDNQVESVLIYDANRAYTLGEFELFDPIRGVIPGVADREINHRSTVDLAIYNMSNDDSYSTDQRGAWGEDQVGKVWWDTSKTKYYDYDQGSYEYRASVWGKQFPGSTIDIYEWTKSSVLPDEWEAAVNSGVDQYGVVASGEVYKVYVPSADEYLYYYTQENEWNDELSTYESVYYFWVKNKTTISSDFRRLTTSDIASIIADPAANGLVWFAPISSTVLILANAGLFVNDTSSVLQITMRPEKLSHASWLAIAEGSDLIPDYWYIGLEDNLIGTQRETGYPVPDPDLHEFNRYGDVRKLVTENKVFAQGWFKDVWAARREAISIINRLLINQNLVEDLRGTWERILKQTYYILTPDTIFGNGAPEDNVSDPGVGDTFYNKDTGEMFVCISVDNNVDPADVVWSKHPGFNMNNTWEWATYVSPNRIYDTKPSKIVGSVHELSLVDPAVHQVVQFSKPYTPDGLSQDEIYQWNAVTSEWELAEKENATIQFNDLVYAKNNIYGWDSSRWEGIWDFDPGVYMGYIIKACREDLFINRFIDNFNELFFGMIRYVASTHNQVDWFYKTTYVKLNIDTALIHSHDLNVKKYTSSHIDEVVDYVNTVKPFHTKVRTIFDKNTTLDILKFEIEELDNVQKSIILDFDTRSDSITVNGDTFIAAFTDGPDVNELFGGEFTGTVDDSYVGQDFSDPQNWNDTVGEYRNTVANLNILEQLDIKIITNISGDTTDNNSRTFVYITNVHGGTVCYSLTELKATTVTTDIDIDSDTITLDNGSMFNSLGGFAYINGEVVKYLQNDNGVLRGVQRGYGSTLAKPYVSGTQIVDITNELISSNLEFTSDKFYHDGSYKSQLGYDALPLPGLSGESILSNNVRNIESQRLQGSTKGILIAE